MLEWTLLYDDGTIETIEVNSTKKAHEIAKEKGAKIIGVWYR